MAVQDGRTRDQHKGWHGTVLPVDNPFWDTHYPPNGWHCRCTIQQLSERDLKRFGYEPSSDPVVKTRKWVNRRTGEVHDVPMGISPGFGHNVGKLSMRPPIDPAKYQLPAIGHESARLAVRQPGFEHFLKGETKGTWPVGYVDDKLASAIGAKVRRVDLSQETLGKQLKEHGELSVDEYSLLPDILQFGRVVQDGERTLAMHYHNNGIYFAAMKSTKTGKAMFLTTFHRASKDDVERIANRGKIIRDWTEE